MYDSVNSTIFDNIEDTFGKLSSTTGKNHMFLCMDIKFIGEEKVAVSTPYHFGKALEDFDKTLK